MNTVLHENKIDVDDVQVCFFLDFASQGRFRRLAPFDFSARDAPQIRPFVSPYHQYLLRVVKDEGSDGYYRRVFLLESFRAWFQVEISLLEDVAQFAEMLDDQIGLCGA